MASPVTLEDLDRNLGNRFRYKLNTGRLKGSSIPLSLSPGVVAAPRKTYQQGPGMGIEVSKY